MSAVIELAGIKKSYGIGTPVVTEVLHGIDLVVGEGEFVALTGPSGSGKSTLLNIVGLLERPTEGRIAIAGKRIDQLNDAGITALRGRTIGFVFQFHHLLPAFSAVENVMMPTIIDRGAADDEAERVAMRLLAQVGLHGHEHKKPGQLSGGQQQRVAIARALALAPKLILADEPTGNLDTRTADEVFGLMRESNAATRSACVIVTHDPRLAQRCDRIVELVDGRIVGQT